MAADTGAIVAARAGEATGIAGTRETTRIAGTKETTRITAGNAESQPGLSDPAIRGIESACELFRCNSAGGTQRTGRPGVACVC